MTAATSASPAGTPPASAGASTTPATTTTSASPTTRKKGTGKGMKLFALCSMFVVWGGYLWTAEYAKTTPNGKEIYLARMQRDIAESAEKVALAKAKIRMKELELEQDGCINK